MGFEDADDVINPDYHSLVAEAADKLSKKFNVGGGLVEAALLKVGEYHWRGPKLINGPMSELHVIEKQLNAAVGAGIHSPATVLEELSKNTAETMQKVSAVSWLNYRGIPLYARDRLRQLLIEGGAQTVDKARQTRTSYWPSTDFRSTIPTRRPLDWPEFFRQLHDESNSRKSFENQAIAVLLKAFNGLDRKEIATLIQEEADSYALARTFIGSGADLLGFGPFAMIISALWVCFELKAGVWETASIRGGTSDLFYEKPRFGARLKAESYFALQPKQAEGLFRTLQGLKKRLRPLLGIDMKQFLSEMGLNEIADAGLSNSGDVRRLGTVDIFGGEALSSLLGVRPPSWWVLASRPSGGAWDWEKKFSEHKERFDLYLDGNKYGPFPCNAKRVLDRILKLPPGTNFRMTDVAVGKSTKKRDIFRACEKEADKLLEQVPDSDGLYRLRVIEKTSRRPKTGA